MYDIQFPNPSMVSLYQKAQWKSSAILLIGYEASGFRFTSGSPGSLRFSYTIIIHIAALDFRSKVSMGLWAAYCNVLRCPLVSTSRPASLAAFAFSSTIIIHIGALVFRSKVSTNGAPFISWKLRCEFFSHLLLNCLDLLYLDRLWQLVNICKLYGFYSLVKAQIPIVANPHVIHI